MKDKEREARKEEPLKSQQKQNAKCGLGDQSYNLQSELMERERKGKL